MTFKKSRGSTPLLFTIQQIKDIENGLFNISTNKETS